MVVGRRGGVAERLVTEAGLELETLDISGVDVSNPRSVVRALSQLPRATLAARRLLRGGVPTWWWVRVDTCVCRWWARRRRSVSRWY